MHMKLKELIDTLLNLQSLTGDDAETNVSCVRLKAEVFQSFDDAGYGYVRRNGKRELSKTIWLDSFADGPQPAPEATFPDFTQGSNYPQGNP